VGCASRYLTPSSSDLRAGVVLVMVGNQGSETVCINALEFTGHGQSYRIEKVA